MQIAVSEDRNYSAQICLQASQNNFCAHITRKLLFCECPNSEGSEQVRIHAGGPEIFRMPFILGHITRTRSVSHKRTTKAQINFSSKHMPSGTLS